MAKGKTVFDPFFQLVVCISCYSFNCWHDVGTPCDIDNCECKGGHH